MDDTADSVQIVESDQYLLGYLTDDRDWNSFIVVLLDQVEQVLAEHFERHH